MSPAIVLVLGTRPEAIKLAPLLAALRRRDLPVRLLLTGQHPLEPGYWGLGDVPATRLDEPGGGHPHRYAARLARRLVPALSGALLAVVQGDTASAYGGALAASVAAVPLAHVEAGLRSFDPAMPWPEEEFRIAIDERAELLFTPTAISADNLRRERVRGTVHVTGNTAIDALLERLPDTVPAQGERPYLLATCHRRENWGRASAGVAVALAALARRGDVEVRLVLHPNPRVRAAMIGWLGDEPGVRLLDPLDHRAMLGQLRGARLVLSDSGGLQEEAPSLGVPLLVLREKTERPEGVAAGAMQLVGTDTARILGAATRLLSDPQAYAAMAQPRFPYGDGRAAERIADHLQAWLDRQHQSLGDRRIA